MLLSQTPSWGVHLASPGRGEPRAHLNLRSHCREGGGGLLSSCSTQKGSYLCWNVLCASPPCPFGKLSVSQPALVHVRDTLQNSAPLLYEVVSPVTGELLGQVCPKGPGQGGCLASSCSVIAVPPLFREVKVKRQTLGPWPSLLCPGERDTRCLLAGPEGERRGEAGGARPQRQQALS